MSTANRRRRTKRTLSSVVVSLPESAVAELLLVWTRVISMAERYGREMETMNRRTNAAKMKKIAGTQNTRAILASLVGCRCRGGLGQDDDDDGDDEEDEGVEERITSFHFYAHLKLEEVRPLWKHPFPLKVRSLRD